MKKTLDNPKTDFQIISETAINYMNDSPAYIRNHKNGIIVQSTEKSTFIKIPVNYPTRWFARFTSSHDEYIRCINTNSMDNVVLDYRLTSKDNEFVPRLFTKNELNKSFGYPSHYIRTNVKTHYTRLFGMTVVPPVVVHILQHLHIA